MYQKKSNYEGLEGITPDGTLVLKMDGGHVVRIPSQLAQDMARAASLPNPDAQFFSAAATAARTRGFNFDM